MGSPDAEHSDLPLSGGGVSLHPLPPLTAEGIATLDTIGGYHADESLRKWPPGSCWEAEGRKLYQLVRELQPEVIVEVGRWEGCSTSHLALGCDHNGRGKVYSIDIAAGMGSKIPPELRKWIQFVTADVFTLTGADVEKLSGRKIDFLLEDGHHSPGFTEHVLRNFSAGCIVVHDYCHWDCQKTVHAECLKVLGEPDEVFLEPPGDCGYALYFRDKKPA